MIALSLDSLTIIICRYFVYHGKPDFLLNHFVKLFVEYIWYSFNVKSIINPIKIDKKNAG